MNQQNAIDTMRQVMRDVKKEPSVSSEPGQVTETNGNLPPGQRRKYALAGKATFTIQSPVTETRFTYRIEKANDDPTRDGNLWFVSVLTGDDNTSDYSYIGIIGREMMFRTTKKSRFPMSAPSVRAFGWFTVHFESPSVNVWHDGHCGRCGRKLTVPSSINAGIGPDCAEKGGF